MHTLAYENLFNVPLDNIKMDASRIVDEGWRLPSYPLIVLTDPIPWDDDAPEHRSWNYHIHSLDMVNVLLLAHSVTGEVVWLRHALNISMDWVKNHVYQEDVKQSKFAWYDMAVGKRAYRLAYMVDAARKLGLLDDEMFAKLWESLLQHADYLSRDENILFHNNHGFYQAVGQMAMGRRFRDVSSVMAQAYKQGQSRFSRMLDSQFTEEGIHREHSPAYHRLLCETLKGVLDAQLVDDPLVEDRMRLIEANLAWFVMPNGRLANFGDSDRGRMSDSAERAARRWLTPDMISACSLGAAGKSPETNIKVFDSSGYFVARNRWPKSPSDAAACSYLAQAAGFHSRTHRQADDLGFIWYDRGSDILVDAGCYGYIGRTKKGSDLWEAGFGYSDPYRIYCESTCAHNTVEVDGKSNPRRGVAPYVSAIKRHGVSGDVVFCETEIKIFKTIRFARLLIFLPGKWLVVFDWLHDNLDIRHDYRQWFHLGTDVALKRSGESYVGLLQKGGQSLQISSLLANVSAGEPCIGQERPSLQGFYSPSNRKIVPNWAFAYEHIAKRSASFATLLAFANKLEPNHEWSQVNATGRKARLRWVDDAHIHTIKLERPLVGEIAISYDVRSKQPSLREGSPGDSVLLGGGIG